MPQFPGQGKPSVGIVFDTGLDRIDDALAMCLLYGFDGKNEVRVVSVSLTRSNLNAAAYCDVVGQFYAAGRTLPIGLDATAKLSGDASWFTALLQKKDSEGKPVYRPAIRNLNDTADPVAVMRNALTAQYDLNAIVFLSGPATNLAHLLALRGGKEWIARKVKLLVIAAGSYPDGTPESYLQTDPAAAQKVFAEWPTPVVACGSELGAALPFPAASIEKDFAWSPGHPVVDAYRAYRAMPYDTPAAAMAAALYAARPNENYFKLSDPGTIAVAADGRTRFAPSAAGRHRYLILNPDQKDHVIKTYTEIASAKPVPRAPRFPGQQQKKEQEKKQ